MTGNDRCSSFIEFTEKTEIEYFMNMNFMIDYDDYKNLSLKEIDEKIGEVQTEFRNLDKSSADYTKEYNMFLCKYNAILRVYRNTKANKPIFAPLPSETSIYDTYNGKDFIKSLI